ncbi:hypothetical protein [uncultured Pelagimonas sp.]|uniref:hypothetical protein n=1 Tax=uncultured Pelagimonas sp. TaxID=1618102 RepID=UPI0026177044|nr:hypothetical protein [uncultured Pelagimonas sp.]
MPLTANYVDQVSSSENDAFRRAALQTLLLSKIEARKASVLKRAIPQALLKTKDNRASIRKTLRGGDLRQLPEMLLQPPVKPINNRDLAEIYWLHGCPNEAWRIMQAPSFRNPFLAVTLIAKRDTERLQGIGNHPNMDDFWKNRFLAIATLLDSSINPHTVLSNYRDSLISYQKSETRPTPPSDLVGVQYALAVLTGNPERQAPPALSSSPDTIAYNHTLQSWKSLSTFLTLIGACAQTQNIRRELLALPAGNDDYIWRTAVEAVDVYCQMEAAAGQRNQ